MIEFHAHLGCVKQSVTQTDRQTQPDITQRYQSVTTTREPDPDLSQSPPSVQHMSTSGSQAGDASRCNGVTHRDMTVNVFEAIVCVRDNY